MNNNIRLYFSETILFLYIISVIVISYNAKYFNISNMIGMCLVAIYSIESIVKKYFVLNVFTPAHQFLFWFIIYNAIAVMFAPEGYVRFETIVQILVLAIVISNIVGSNYYVVTAKQRKPVLLPGSPG